jgi:hypothetical protein
MQRDLSPLTTASFEGGNVVIHEVDASGPTTAVRVVCLRPEEWRALAEFLARVEAASQPATDEPMCGAIHPEDDACCVELEGHEDAGLDHLWVGGVRNLCMATPIRLALLASERKDGGR